MHLFLGLFRAFEREGQVEELPTQPNHILVVWGCSHEGGRVKEEEEQGGRRGGEGG